MCAKISEKMVACRGIYEETYEQLAQLKNGQSILMHEDYFSQFTYPLRRAAQSEGLKMTSGKIYRKNNHGSSHILIFPKSISVFVLDVGGLFHWSDTLAISAQYQRQEHTYQIEKIMSFKDCFTDALCDAICSQPKETVTLAKEEMKRLLNAYEKNLILIGVGRIDPFSIFSGWQEPKQTDHRFKYNIERTMLEEYFKTCPSSIQDQHIPTWNASIESVFFAATLFSLCKPLFSWCNLKVDTHFSLQLLPETMDSLDTAELIHAHHILDGLADFWCNYRAWEDRGKKNEYGGKFRRNWDSPDLGSMWNHLCFPLAFTNYKRISSSARSMDDVKLYSQYLERNSKKIGINKKQLAHINQSKCLPILLPLKASSSLTLRACAEKDCLTLSFGLNNTQLLLKQFDDTDITISN